MKYSRVRFALLTFALGTASVGFFDSPVEKLNAFDGGLPQVNSETPIVVQVCPRRRNPQSGSKDDGGGCGGADDAMCESIPVAFSEGQK